MSSETSTRPARAGWAGGLRWYLPIVVTGLGVALRGPEVAVLALLALLAVLAVLRVRAWMWATGALAVVVLSPVLNRMGVVPDVVTFAHFPLVYLGLAAVLLRCAGRWTAAAGRVLLALAGLLLAACLSAVLQHTEALRPLVAFAIWAESFVLVLLLLLEPPSEPERRRLLAAFGALVAVQVPFAVWQAVTLGSGDQVKGTLNGPHDLGAFAVLGGLALMTWGYDRASGAGLASTIIALPLLAALPVLADAKQVILSLPAAAAVLLATTQRLSRKLLIATALTGTVALLLTAVPAGRTAASFLGGAASGRFGKAAGLEVALGEMRAEWTNAVFGLGPANGLSRVAFLTADPHALRGSAPLARFHLAPAVLPAQGEAQAQMVAQGTSFNSSIASATGIFTDVGLVGFLAFLWLLIVMVAPLVARRRDWLARAALAGWALSAPLALTSQWWEVPSFMLPLALLTAVAIAPAGDDQPFPALPARWRASS